MFSGPNKERLLVEVILQHFYRQVNKQSKQNIKRNLMQGQLEISSTLAREAGVDELAEQRQPFLEVKVLLV